MGIHRGPNPVKDELVFGYDTGYGLADNSTATRFYPGKAVDNEFYNSGPDGTILDYVGYGGTGTAQSGALDALGTTDNIVYRKTGKLRFGPTGGDDIGTLYYGNTYTFSIYMRHVPGLTQMSGGEFDINDQSSGGKNYSGTLSSNMTYEWKRFSVTSTHTNSSNYHFIDIGTYQGTGVFEWCCPQIELGTIASPFTNTERTSTQSLIDLKETTDIDVSNVSFDSTGQPTFDGTSDYIQNSSYTSHQQSKGTLEVVIKPTIISGNRYVAGVGGTTTYGASRMIRINGGTLGIVTYGSSTQDWSGVTAATVNQYQHVVATWSGTSLQMYVNNVPYSATRTGVVSPLGTNITMGRPPWAAGSYYAGSVDIFKHYNKVLSAAEVQQNYNAYKKRFSI